MHLFTANIEMEATAENEGDTNALQQHQQKELWQRSPEVLNCLCGLLNTEYDLRAIAQCEIRVQSGAYHPYGWEGIRAELSEIKKQT